ncbi:coiled-coil domain-containing protein [Geobacter argillaceus]|uniref:Uncharacterized protein n=1 Tax=Geobacter argillaceus TaxID=345631 RepID=A0A562WTA8_9BACT|nr:hypothetical protein [Geobacter argillaceus]TWJ32674.1 hypothetical protein JN12_00649 [Geobacter argillaceus]
MSFSFNPSVEYVKIDEPSLYELFQSKSPVVPDDPSFCGRQCEAYICTAREGQQLRIFVSFLDTGFKQIHVYTPDSDPTDAADYLRLLAQAHEFVAAKGFVVEKVNIDFSAAIRQVIIRSLRIMRPPAASQKKLLHLVPPVEKSLIEPAVVEKPLTAPHKEQVAPEQIALLRSELAEALAARDTTAKKSENELAAVQKLLAKAVAEKEALEQQLTAEKAAGAAALEGLQAESAALTAHLVEERAINKSLIEKLQSELDTAAGVANAELAALAGELAGARASLTHLEQVQNELQEARLELTQLSKDNSLILVELEQLAEERKAERAASADELVLLRAENERLTKALLIQEQVAQREQTALRAELRAMVAEMAAGGALPVQHSVPSPDRDNVVAPPAVASTPLTVPEQEHEDLHEEEADASSSGAEEALAMLDPESPFSAAGADSTTEFGLDAGLDTVPYRSSVDVLAVFLSINTVQAVPIGREVQKCSGYVCAVAEEGLPRIYIAWHMPESGRVAVYVPHQQPADKASCATVLRDAIQYFEIMGFMMEKHDLGATPQKRRSVLKKIPVLKRVEKGHAEHPQQEPLRQSA